MSTQFEPPYEAKEDQSPTDSLPVLDVQAYENSLFDRDGEEISRTDSWRTDTLVALDTISRKTLPEVAARKHASLPVDLGAAELGGDVGLILKRIGELEGQVLATRNQNSELRRSMETLNEDRAAKATGIQALQADNARLTEHRAIGAELVARLEEKLRDQSAEHSTQVASLQTLHSEERENHEKVRTGLQQQIADQSLLMAGLQKEQRRLKEDFDKLTELAVTRAQSINNLENLLAQSETSAQQLARQLAGKLVEHESQARTVELRNRTITELKSAMAALGTQLRTTITNVNEISEQLADAHRELSDSRAQLSQRATDLADRDGRVAHLSKDIRQSQDELAALSTQHDATLATLSSTQKAHAAAQNELEQLTQQVVALREGLQTSKEIGNTLQTDLRTAESQLAEEQKQRRALEAARAERQRQIETLQADLSVTRDSLRNLTIERDALLPVRQNLAETSAALEQNVAALAAARRDVAQLKTEHATQAERSRALQAELGVLQQTNEELRAARDALQRAMLEAQQLAEGFRQQTLSQALSLQEKVNEMQGLRTLFDERGDALASTQADIGTRDEIIDELKQQLHTAEKERTAATQETEAARLRVEALSRHVAGKSQRIAALKSDLAVYGAALGAIRRNLHRLNGDEAQEHESSAEAMRFLEPVEHAGEHIMLDRKVTTVGRTSENDICVPYKVVSRRHARLLATPSGVIVEDAGSTNGCFVNGRQVRQQLLREGDILGLGDLRYRLCTTGAPTTIVETRSRGNVIAIEDARRPND